MSDKQYTQDWCSAHFPLWQQVLAPLAGKPIRALEIGVFEGRSTVWFMENILTHPDARLKWVDTFEGGSDHAGMDLSGLERRFLDNVALFGDKVSGRARKSMDALKQYSDSPGSLFDFIYIDGSHEAPDVLADAVLAWPLLKPGGFMGFDDYQWQKFPEPERRPKLAIDSFLAVMRRECEVVHKGFQVWVQKRAAPAESGVAFNASWPGMARIETDIKVGYLEVPKPGRTAILVPTKDDIEPETREAIQKLINLGGYDKYLATDGSIDIARSCMASQALANGCTDLLWVDSDIVFTVEDVLKLKSHNLPFVCGTYVKRTKKELTVNFVGPKGTQIKMGAEGGLYEVEATGFGFVLTKAEIYKTIREHHRLPECDDLFGGPFHPYFIPVVIEYEGGLKPKYLPEDFAFSFRCREAGIKMMCDTTIKLSHIGRDLRTFDKMFPVAFPDTLPLELNN